MVASPRFQGYAGQQVSGVTRLCDVDLAVLPRFSSGMGEFDRVLGVGLVPGSVVLIGGNPGAGKSTLLLQTSSSVLRPTCARPSIVTGEAQWPGSPA
jgi:predicted ATP-dependent serine protease